MQPQTTTTKESLKLHTEKMIREQKHDQSAARAVAHQHVMTNTRIGVSEADVARTAAIKALKNDELVRNGKRWLDKIMRQQKAFDDSEAKSAAKEDKQNAGPLHEERHDFYSRHARPHGKLFKGSSHREWQELLLRTKHRKFTSQTCP